CMTKSLTKELCTPFENPERECLSSRKLFKTPSLDESSLPEFNLFSDLEEYSKEETRSTETYDGLVAIQAQLNNLGREIKKVNEKVYAAQVGCKLCKGPHYTNDCPLKEEGKTLEEAYYTQFGVPFQQGRQYRAVATLLDDSLPQKEKDPGSFTLPCYINSICFEKALADLRASLSVMLLSTYLNLGLGELAHTKLIIELADRTVKHPKGIAENVLVGIVMENMDIRPDKERGDIIIGEPFCKVSCVEAKRFDGLITIHNGKCTRPAKWNLALVSKAQDFL
ncbi:retrovirus-related pol polyprotein from transposon TNT 1-94, partial [Tanacetum coccineum]